MTSRSDPRAAMPVEAGTDVRPVVALPRSGVPSWVLVALAVLAGLLLFGILDSRRRAATAPPVAPGAAESVAMPAPPPPLVVPPAIVPVAPPSAPPVPRSAPARSDEPTTGAPEPQIVYVQQPVPAPMQAEAPPPPRISAEPALVLDTGAPRAAAVAEGGGEAAMAVPGAAPVGVALPGTRTRAGVLANRSTTVPQGTLIPAVLETALDSTRPGFARAIVSQDVRGFDGLRTLIPRGSRLIGEYRSDTQPGQGRAMVNWFRLIRPDGATIAIGSPTADPVGRGGVRARVNSHFMERFLGALLQSTLDIGVNLASRAGSGAVVVLPGAVQNTTQSSPLQQQVTPTLTVRQGTSISIFVNRDLDFTGVEARQ